MFQIFDQEAFLDELKQNPEKKYRIGAVAQLLDLKVHVIRYWEKEFNSFIKPKKTSGGQSLYSVKDLENFLNIKKLLHTEKYSVSGAKKKLKDILYSEKAGVNLNVSRDLLVVIKEELEDIRADLKKTKDNLNNL
jgi:DNA-binding transcriptional MerR regulator